MNFLRYRFTLPQNFVSLALLLVLANGLGTLLLSFAVVQAQQEQPRKITSDAFTRHRKNGVRDKGSQRQSLRTQAKAKTSREYRLASSAIKIPTAVSYRSSLAQLGITTWRLRPVTVTDTGAALVLREKDSASGWIPERVRADTKFREGDFVRLSVESPKTGYLYILDRDIFADGTIGQPVLIYPWRSMRFGENLVRPGKVVDIPGQEDNPSYFTARPARSDQIGEMLTFLVTTTPLDLPFREGQVRISEAQMAKWEKTWNAQSERFEMEGGQGQSWTREEQQAGLRLQARQLTRDDPAPQTIYRVATSNKFGFMVSLQLTYK